ncbi:unnamed protein product [Jaminaea pallidilutea]
MKAPALALCRGIAALAFILPAGVHAGLKHPDAKAIQQLADLTRPDHLKHFPDEPFGSFDQRSRDLGYKVEGVDWKVTHTQTADADASDRDQVLRFQVPGLEPTLANGETKSEANIHGLLDRLKAAAESVIHRFEEDSHDHDVDRQTSEAGDEGSNNGDTGPDASQRSSFSPTKPPSFPLAVRGPYANAWLPAGSFAASTPPNRVGNGGYLAGQEPSFWTSSYGATGDHRLGWHGFIRIDNTTYQWMGDAFGNTVRAGKDAQQVSAEYTSTRSIFRFEADGVQFNVTFMTPIWPHDFVRQSIPLSYLHFQVDSASASGRSVQMYVDIDERWITAHVYDWENYPYRQDYRDLKGVSRWYLTRDRPETFVEYKQRAEWGDVTWAARDRSALYARNNNNVVTQLEFLDRGLVTNSRDRVAGDNNAFAYAVDFDSKHGEDEALFAIGHFRDPYINYVRAKHPGSNSTKSYQEERYGYWAANFTRDEAVTFFLDDFENALKHCIKLDDKIASESKAVVGGGSIGDRYAAITQLSVRQSMATIEITLSKNSTGDGFNTSDPLIFLKEISSNGDMSTVDVMFPQFPLLTYLNPELLRLVMQPIFEYTESGLYPNKWCVHDLGVYPNATGHADGKDEPMQVEESGNMILMTLHWAQLVGDKVAVPYLKDHYRIMEQWAEYLIEDSLIPASQLSTDDFAGVLANQTNLAIKGIEGVASMAAISDLIGETKNASYYRNISTTYIKEWQKLAIDKKKTHVKLAYQDNKSWGTLYNLYADRLLNLKLVPRSVYDMQDKWYPQVAQRWGVPLDSRHNWTKSDWEMFTSAVSSSNSTRNLFIDKLYRFYSNGRTDAPATDLYESTTGDFPKQPFDPLIYFLARPVVGGHFMHLALAAADKANGIDADHPYAYGPKSNDVLAELSVQDDDSEDQDVASVQADLNVDSGVNDKEQQQGPVEMKKQQAVFNVPRRSVFDQRGSNRASSKKVVRG